MIATGSMDNTARLWDVETGEVSGDNVILEYCDIYPHIVICNVFGSAYILS